MKRITEYWHFEKEMNFTILKTNAIIQVKDTFNRTVG